jgi:CBS domain-containing protein
MGAMTVRDAMTAEVCTVAPGMSLHDVARLLVERGISGAPVVDAYGELIGVISEGDFLVKERGLGRRPANVLDRLLGRADEVDVRRLSAQTAVQAMSTPAVTIGPDDTLREAAALMLDRAVNRLPVVSDGRLVGILTRADLVRAYIRRDDETLQTIRDEVLHDTMWMSPDDLEVDVTDGLVRLAGTVDRRSTATILVKLIGLVDGADRVESHLTWDLDDTRLGPPPGEAEPGAASLLAREAPQSLHR